MFSLRNLVLSGAVWCVSSGNALAATTNSSACADSGVGPPFNATGTVSFIETVFQNNHGKPWYLSIALADKGSASPDSLEASTRRGYVSVPNEFVTSTEANTTFLCAYKWEEKNVTAASDGSCRGILSDTCIKYIESVQAGATFGKCPLLNNNPDCMNVFSIDDAFPSIDKDCPIGNHSTVPGIPEGYSAQQIFGEGASGNHVLSSQELEAQMKQTTPVLLLFSKREGQDEQATVMHHSQLLCVAPVNMTAGNKGPASLAADFSVSKASLLAFTAAAILGGLLL